METGEPLVGFEDGRKDLVSVTEKVRIKSVAEEGRVRVVEVREGSGGDSSDDEDGEGEGEGDSEEEEQVGTWEMETARVYERTIQLLGDELGRLAGFGEMQVDVSRC